jgi:hypothetical protein
VYVASRRVGVRPSLAVLAPLGYLVLCQSAWPIVSQHWISTLLCALLLMICAGRVPARTRWALWAGVVLGLLLAVQQQRGAFMAAGVAMWLIGDAALRRRYASAPPLAALITEAAAMAAGGALALAPLLAVAVVQAGLGAVWYALVTFPIFNYRSEIDFPWGDVNVMTAANARLTFALVLKYFPAVLLPTAARLAGLCYRGRDLRTAAQLWLLLAFCAASTLSIAYSPDFIHIAFIAFVFLVPAVENLEWLLARMAPPRRLATAIGWSAAALATLVSARHLLENRVLLRRSFPASHPTAFGRVDFPMADEGRLRDEVAALLDHAPSRALYTYPIIADLYHTVPADNPTPYGFFLAGGYHSPEEVERVIEILKERQLPYVVLIPGLIKPDDVVGRYLLEAYEPMSPPLAGRVIYRRRDGS